MIEAGGGPRGTVFNVQRASFHDGPGIRTTVFLKGCPLSCSWCHNPEGIRPQPQVMVNATRCIGCGSCTEACRRQGGPLVSGELVGSDGCLACGECFDACPTAAREMIGEQWTVPRLLGEVARDRLSYDTSGGGVTFSGGEPLFQAEFLLACLAACRREGIRTAVDTCGFAADATVRRVVERADLLLWDLKHLDPDRHRELTGAPLAPILANLEAVARAGVPIWLRIPVIPGVNDHPSNMAATADVAASLPAVERVCLLPYHRTGTGKNARLGREDVMAPVPPPARERMAELAAVFAARGVETTIGG